APDREVDALAVERLLPGQHVLVDAVDERAVEVEQEGGRCSRHGWLLVVGLRDAFPEHAIPDVMKPLADPDDQEGVRAHRGARHGSSFPPRQRRSSQYSTRVRSVPSISLSAARRRAVICGVDAMSITT